MKQTTFIAYFGVILALSFMIQMVGLPQIITGPLVNGMLLITVEIFGFAFAIALGFLTPLLALIRGHLPPVLYMLIPFIILGNLTLILVFHAFRRLLNRRSVSVFWQWIVALVPAAIAKTAILTLSVRWVFPLIFGKQLPSPIVLMMTTPQLFTALGGGILAYFIVTVIGKTGVVRRGD